MLTLSQNGSNYTATLSTNGTNYALATAQSVGTSITNVLNALQWGSTVLSNLVSQSAQALNGASFTNLNGANIASGFVAVARQTNQTSIPTGTLQVEVTDGTNAAATNGLNASILTSGTISSSILGILAGTNVNVTGSTISMASNPAISLLNLQGNVPSGQSGIAASTNLYITGSTLSLQTNPAISLVNLQGNVPSGQSGMIAGTNMYLTGSTMSLQTNPSVGVANLQGTIGTANLPPALVTLNTNNGSALTNLNASSLASGNVPDGRMAVDYVTTNASVNSVNNYTGVTYPITISTTGPTNNIGYNSSPY